MGRWDEEGDGVEGRAEEEEVRWTYTLAYMYENGCAIAITDNNGPEPHRAVARAFGRWAALRVDVRPLPVYGAQAVQVVEITPRKAEAAIAPEDVDVVLDQ